MNARTSIVVASLLLPLGAAAQIVPRGSEFQINSHATNSQDYPAMAAWADGSFVVAWESDGQDGDFSGVFGQRYNSAGQASGSEFQINSYTNSSQHYVALTAGADGSFVAAWNSFGQDGEGGGIFGRRFGSAGQALGSEFQVNSYTNSGQGYVALAAGADGSFVVAWDSFDQDGDAYGVFGQRFDSAGQALGSEFQVNSYTNSGQGYVALAAGADGAFVVAWMSYYQDGEDEGVFGQRYDSAGQVSGTEFQVSIHTIYTQSAPAVAAVADGGFVVAWFNYDGGSGDGSDGGVFGQRYDSAGQVSGTEFQINSHTMGTQQEPAVAAGADGSFVVAWESFGQDGSSRGIFGQRYDGAGQVSGTEFQINSYTTSIQAAPAVAAGADGSFVVAWESFSQDGSSWGVFGQRFGELTCPSTPQICAPATEAQLQIKLDASDAKDKLKLKLGGGVLTQANFGDPTTTETYLLCIYDDLTLKMAMKVGPSGSLWSLIGDKGYKYLDQTGASDGITKIKLLGGGGPAPTKLRVKGKGANLPMPTPVSGTQFFDQTFAVYAQLHQVGGGLCYMGEFLTADTTKNDGTQFKAKK